MRAEVTWLKGLRFTAKSDSNHDIVVEAPEEGQEETLGPTPMELMLMGIGACTAADVVWILRKQRMQLEKLEVRLEAERAATEPKRFTKINLEYVFDGKGLTDKAVNRAIQLSQEKYCSAVSSVVTGGAVVTATHRIIQ